MTLLKLNPENTMNKIYKFECLNSNLAVTVDEVQPDPNQVILRVHQEDSLLLLPFSKAEFHELCNMRYRLDYPETTAQTKNLVLVS